MEVEGQLYFHQIVSVRMSTTLSRRVMFQLCCVTETPTFHENFAQTSARCRAVPSSVPELVLAFLGAKRHAFCYFFEECWLFLAYVSEPSAQASRLLADERRVHHHVTAHGPANQSINQSVSQSEVLFVSNRPTFTFTVMDCIAMSQGNKESTELQTAEMRFLKSVDTYKSIHEMRNGCVHV
jgi:hypothetical protein